MPLGVTSGRTVSASPVAVTNSGIEVGSVEAATGELQPDSTRKTTQLETMSACLIIATRVLVLPRLYRRSGASKKGIKLETVIRFVDINQELVSIFEIVFGAHH